MLLVLSQWPSHPDNPPYFLIEECLDQLYLEASQRYLGRYLLQEQSVGRGRPCPEKQFLWFIHTWMFDGNKSCKTNIIPPFGRVESLVEEENAIVLVHPDFRKVLCNDLMANLVQFGIDSATVNQQLVDKSYWQRKSSPTLPCLPGLLTRIIPWLNIAQNICK